METKAGIVKSINGENMKIEKVDTKSEHFTIYNNRLLDFLYEFENIVRVTPSSTIPITQIPTTPTS